MNSYSYDTPPQFAKLSRENQIRQIVIEKEDNLNKWIYEREFTINHYLYKSQKERIHIILAEAQRLEKKDIDNMLETIKDQLAHKAILISWRAKWKELSKQLAEMSWNCDMKDIIKYLSIVRLFNTMDQRSVPDLIEINRCHHKENLLKEMRNANKTFLNG